MVFLIASLQLQAQSVGASNTPIAIPDNSLAGVDVFFNVPGSGIEVSSVSLILEIEHTWLGDVAATLTAPNGAAQMVIFSRVGGRIGSSFGDSTDFNGTLIFDDRGGDLWQTAANLGENDAVISGTYTASTAGQPALSNYGGQKTSLKGAFGNLISGSTGVQGEGQWVLNVSDGASGDVGNLVSATLMINSSDHIYNSAFEAPYQPAPQNRLDLTGNGLADFGVLREGDENVLDWRVLQNLSDGDTGAEDTFVLGNALTDFWNNADFDGDGISDAAAYNPPTQTFLIKRSARPGSSALPISIGSPNDQPTVVGDYDGDGINDPATFTTGVNTNDPNSLQYVSSVTGLTITVPMGINDGTFQRILGGEDYSGDGRADVAVISEGEYTVRDGQNGTVINTFTFGLATDPVFLMGNFSGDDRADFTRVFVVSSDVIWQTIETGTGVISAEVTWGALVPGSSEFAASGDYDGDGYLDYTVWRRDNATPDNAQFIIRPSSNTGTTTTVIHGTLGEAPLAGAQSG
jgi:subtilisin-like proprotein convertase family protein